MKAILLVVLFATLAQAIPSCGGDEAIIGFVDEKHKLEEGGTPTYILVVNRVEYNVPPWFWNQVGVGDIVKFDKGVWSIVRKAG